MSNIVTIVSDAAAFLASVRVQAQKTGKAQSDMVALLKSGAIDWANEDQVADVARAYRVGRIAASLGVSIAKAGVIELAGKKGRDEAQTKAYNAAKVSWYETARAADMPKKDMTPRAPRADAETAKAAKEAEIQAAKDEAIADAMLSGKAPLPAKVKAKVELAQALTERAETFEDVQAFAVRVAKLVEAFDKKAGKSVERGPFRSILWDFVKAVNKAAAAPEVSAPAHAPNGASVASVASAAVHAAA